MRRSPQPKDIVKKQIYVRCENCLNEIPDEDGISFRMSDHSFFLCRCKKGHHINKYGNQEKLFVDKDRICGDFKNR